MSGQTLILLEGKFAICRLPPTAEWPLPSSPGGFFQVTRTDEELSVLCPESEVPSGAEVVRGNRIFKIQGPLDHGLIGISASLAQPLALAQIPIFLIATFDTDYLCLHETNLEAAKKALLSAGHRIA